MVFAARQIIMAMKLNGMDGVGIWHTWDRK
jgi:hypothetical protein